MNCAPGCQCFGVSQAAGPTDKVGQKQVHGGPLLAVIGTFLICFFLAVKGLAGQAVPLTGGELDWLTSDIGSVGVAGSASLAQGVFTLRGSGADIWDKADAFRYGFQMQHGDGTLTARVLRVSNTDNFAKAGIMIRESLNPDAKYAFVYATPTAGALFEQRDGTASKAKSVTTTPVLAAAYWLRLTRQGDVFTAYFSENGSAWTKMGSTTMAMFKPVYVGLAVCAHKFEAVCEAQFDQVTGLADPEVKLSPATKLVPSHASGESAWETLDIGKVSLPGSFSQDRGVFTIRGSGADIWDQADAFRYVFQSQYGDFSCVARVLQVSKAHEWSKAGIMVRESLSPDAKYALVFVTPSLGAKFQQRTSTAGQASDVTKILNKATTYWICLARRGNVFTAYISENGVNWSVMGSTTIDLSKQAYVGLAVTAHNADAVCEAQIDKVVLRTIGGKAGGLQ